MQPDIGRLWGGPLDGSYVARVSADGKPADVITLMFERDRVGESVRFEECDYKWDNAGVQWLYAPTEPGQENA